MNVTLFACDRVVFRHGVLVPTATVGSMLRVNYLIINWIQLTQPTSNFHAFKSRSLLGHKNTGTGTNGMKRSENKPRTSLFFTSTRPFATSTLLNTCPLLTLVSLLSPLSFSFKFVSSISKRYAFIVCLSSPML